jgi:hypothetical protein
MENLPTIAQSISEILTNYSTEGEPTHVIGNLNIGRLYACLDLPYSTQFLPLTTYEPTGLVREVPKTQTTHNYFNVECVIRTPDGVIGTDRVRLLLNSDGAMYKVYKWKENTYMSRLVDVTENEVYKF